LPNTLALIGAAGFVAPRPIRAMKGIDGRQACALDPEASVGIIDSYDPDARFFVELERFDRRSTSSAGETRPSSL
jgi:UDP-N-acetyl-2-amino-2-deoxyglucuronate dehydrogenase